MTLVVSSMQFRRARSKQKSSLSPCFTLLFLLFWSLSWSFPTGLLAQDKKIALTFDDLPALGPFGFWRPREISNIILRTLEQRGIKAAGFVVEEKVDDEPSTYVVLLDWASRGHIVGNQTYSDVDLNQLSAEDFLHHVVDGQKYLRRASRTHRFNYRYLRYPFLHQGDTKRKKENVAKALYNGGYETAHVTVKTSDYRFNPIYIENEQDPQKIAQLKSIYLEHIGKALDYAESQSQNVFERNINHILWLHCGVATANFLEDLLEMLQNRGYQSVSFPEALADPAFTIEENYVGPLGLSFIDRVAASRGLPFDPEQGELSSREIEAGLVER
ncbi:polysaccharide deacetylase family protein [Acidobacteria bacterium AH-259-L09]|nr:polysaccharide deacetylase family protein [Acidobacteria bacterium AH-259-L09]